MGRTRIGFIFVLIAAVVLQVAPRRVDTQALPPEAGSRVLTVAASDTASVRMWDDEVTRMERDGRLRMVREREDTLVVGRHHQRLAQFHDNTPVFGGEVTRQSDGNDLAVSLFGTLYSDISVPATPRLSAEGARSIMLAQPDAQSVIGEPELYVLPLDQGGFALAYRTVTVFAQDMLVSFVDSETGRVLLQFSDMQTQSNVGKGRGVLGDSKKISTDLSGGSYRAQDGMRPPSILTYDLKANLARTVDVLNGRVSLAASDLAVDADNDWTDGAVVDAHVYAGWTYDYYFKRFGRRGLDNNNLTMRSIVHPVSRDDFATRGSQYPTLFANAFWSGALRLMVYGVGLPTNVRDSSGRSWNFLSGSLNVVSHELTHGVTQFSSNLTYLGEAGALNEAFSDIMAVSAEFYHAAALGRAADYVMGEEVVTPGGIRSMSNPASLGQPDHYTRRYLGTNDNGGVHINSGVPNHAFYLAIEGGTNRTSGGSVTGVGAANREQIEKVFHRAFTLMLTPTSNFYAARLATIQSARDLYGAGSAAERAVTQAWDAVGVQQQATANLQYFFFGSSSPAPAGRCSLTAPNFNFEVDVVEMSGVAFNVASSQVRFYNGAGVLSSAQPFNFAQLFNYCGPGSNRIAPIGIACANICISFGGAPGGFVDFSVSGTDDNGVQGTFTSPRVRLGTVTSSTDTPAPAVQGTLVGAKE